MTRKTLLLMVLALGIGCGGGESTPEPATQAAVETTPEPTPEPTPEAVAAADDDDSSKPAGDDDDSSKPATEEITAEVAAADEPAADAAPHVDEPAASDEPVGDPDATPAPEITPEDPNQEYDPTKDGSDEGPTPFTLNAIGARDGASTGKIEVLLRVSPPSIYDQLSFTANVGPAKAKGPKITENKEDYTLVWTVTGLPKTEFKGSVTASRGKQSVKEDFVFGPFDDSTPVPTEE